MLLNFKNGRVQITFTKDELIDKINRHCFICWAIEESIEEICGRVCITYSFEVLDAIRKLTPNRFRRAFSGDFSKVDTLECALLSRYLSRTTTSDRAKFIATRVNLIKSIPSNEITFDLSYTPLK